MTSQEEIQARLYAEAIQKWEYRKNHFFVFGHDGLSFTNWISDYFRGWKSGNWKLLVAIYASLLVFFGLLSLLSKTMRIVSLFCIGSCLVVLPFVIIYNYFMYLNYSTNDSGIYFGAAYIAIGIGAWELFKTETTSVVIHVAIQLVILFILLRICKSIYFKLEKPRLEDFKSQ